MLLLAETTAKAFCDETSELFGLLGIAITVIKIVIPIILIILGMLDMGKAVTAGKDDEIKKSALTFLRRAVAAVLVFFIPSIVGIIMGTLNNGNVGGNNDYCECIRSLQLTRKCS